MTEFSEKRYSIDPGKGKKMPGCPYSNFEDGHDVQEYIIPPKGYVFAGFKFDPNASNQIYDGKLTAEYTKEPFKDRIKSNLWKFAMIFAIIAIVGLVIILVFSVFKDPKPNPPTEKPAKPKTEIKKEKKRKSEQKTDNSLIEQKSKNEAVENKPETKEAPAAEKVEDTMAPAPAVEQQTESQPKETISNEPNAVFKQEFWYLIHQKNPSMDTYTDLYNKYKSSVSGEEFDYLRFTILQNYASFKTWYDKLNKVPDSELNAIKTIESLRGKLK